MKSRKREAALVGLQLGVMGAAAIALLAGGLQLLDLIEERDHYKELCDIEAQSTQLLLDHQFKSMVEMYDQGTDVINIEIPCTVDKGVVHQVMYKVVR